jgi:glycerol-3-phosphate acyltransferase PlsY
MIILPFLAATLSGYLMGSISFARIVARLHPSRIDVTATEVSVEAFGANLKVPMHGVSATSLRFKVGGRWGCLTSLLDMLKVVLPVFIFRWLYPDMSYYFIAATTAVIGHNWPVYHKFNGGYGVSAVYGGLMVIDWLGLLLTVAVSMAFYFIAVQIKFGRILASMIGLLAMIPWAWFHHHDWYYLAYALVFNIAYLVRLYPDIRKFLKMVSKA